MNFYLQALEETQMLRVTNMSTAVLCVYIDSAMDLPQARVQSKPDPFVTLSVGKFVERTSTLKRTDVPVWEQGFTFLVANPENDTLKLNIVDHKTDKDLGEFSYTLNSLLSKTNLELVSQPFQLQKSGPTSKITLSLKLKILKKAPKVGDDSIVYGNAFVGNDSPKVSNTRTSSESSAVSSTKLADFPLSTRLAEFPSEFSNTNDSGIQEPAISVTVENPLLSPSRSTDTNGSLSGRLIHRARRMSTSSSTGIYGLGRIQITLRYNIQRQRLIVIVHKIA